MEFTKEKALSLFELAGFKVIGEVYTLENGYWGSLRDRDLKEWNANGEHKYSSSAIEHAIWVAKSPWFLVELEELGFVKIGWRKRVLNIDWSRTDVRRVVTQDDVTKDETMVHAWSYPKAVEYLTALRGY